MVVFDTTTLLVAIAPPSLVAACVDGHVIPDARERVDYLIKCLDKGTKVIIPTPVLAEALVRAGPAASQQYVDKLSKSAAFEIVNFDTLAALEAAEMARQAIAAGSLRMGATGPRQKIKVDRQIVAIAKVLRCSTIYSNDTDIAAIAKGSGVAVVGIEQLPLPPPPPQPDANSSLFDYVETHRETPV